MTLYIIIGTVLAMLGCAFDYKDRPYFYKDLSGASGYAVISLTALIYIISWPIALVLNLMSYISEKPL